MLLDRRKAPVESDVSDAIKDARHTEENTNQGSKAKRKEWQAIT